MLLSGKKKIEVRTRNTNHRGWFYIYAAKKDTKEAVVKKFGYKKLPTGLIIGKAFLQKVKKYASDTDFYKDSDSHLATRRIINLEGWALKTKYGYIISKTERIKPVSCRGMPGFFQVGSLKSTVKYQQ